MDKLAIIVCARNSAWFRVPSSGSPVFFYAKLSVALERCRKQFWAVAVGVLSVLLVSVSGCLLVYQALAYGWYGDINNELNTYEPVGAIAPEQELQPL